MPDDQLVVRAATPDDAPFLHQLRTDPATAEYLAVSDQDEADLRAELDADDPERGGRLIGVRDHDPLAALRWALVNQRSRIVELSDVIVDPQARGQRVAGDLVRAACRRLLAEHDIHRFQLEVYGDNHSAHQAFRRAGFQREGLRRQAYWRRGTWQDGVLYGLLAYELPRR
jgi:RimJ/RimL family protein N-acetyltransferase